MPYADPEKYREYQRNYQRNYQKKLREKMTQQQKQEKSEFQKEYMKSYVKDRDKYHKYDTIYNWKNRNVIETWYYNYDELYEWYLKTNHCEECGITLTQDKKRKSTTKCLHHNHNTNEFEMIVCHACNVRLK